MSQHPGDCNCLSEHQKVGEMDRERGTICSLYLLLPPWGSADGFSPMELQRGEVRGQCPFSGQHTQCQAAGGEDVAREDLFSSPLLFSPLLIFSFSTRK